MTLSFQTLGRIIALMFLLIINGCSDSSTDPATKESKVDHPEISARVSGAVNAHMSGAGTVIYMPRKARDLETGIRPGYFLITNLQPNIPEQSGFIITFRIPEEAEAGNYNLVTPDPLKLGERFEVKIETVQAGQSISYQTNTEGMITLERFSPDPTDSHIGNITGTFQFVTENREGKQLSANGAFNFPSRKNMVSQGPGYLIKRVSGTCVYSPFYCAKCVSTCYRQRLFQSVSNTPPLV